jgi:DNA-binding response OmpR family regulator
MFHSPESPLGAAAVLSNSPWGARDKALIIEDNEGIAGLLSLVLGKSGLQVIWCQDGRSALEKFKQHGESIAFVHSDCRLPDSDGREICQQMRDLRPELPIVLSSGSAACLTLGPLTSGRWVWFLPKPYSPKELLGRIQKLQDAVKLAG